MESKKTESTKLSPRKTTIAILAALSVSLALADDFKTNNGKEYKNAIVTQVDPDGIVVRTKTAISKLYFPELPEDVQTRYHYDPAKAAAAQAAEMTSVQQTNQQIEEFNKHRQEAEQQKALENQLSQLRQQEQDLRAQIGGVNNSAARETETYAHERSKLGLGEIASGGGVHAADAQLALTYDSGPNKKLWPGT